MTGIDPWEYPQKARQRLLELIPQDVGEASISDEPLPRPADGQLTLVDEQGQRSARWGPTTTWHWNWGEHFASIDDVLAYDPLECMDQRAIGIESAAYDYGLSVDELARHLQQKIDQARAVTDQRALVPGAFYNTLFMWPLLTFGWELFLELGAPAYSQDMSRLLAQFAVRSRRITQAWAKTDVEVFISHDDICYARGPIFSPDWLRRMIYPYYEEFWTNLKQAGKKIIFVCDGNVDMVADDIFACGADGVRSEPFTNWREIAEKHPDKVLVGDGDNRVLATEDREAIFKMVRRMTEWGKRHPGYFCCVGNHLPWNLSSQAIQYYFDASEEFGWR